MERGWLDGEVIHFIARRLVQLLIMLFLLSIVLFALVNLAPGGPLAEQGQSRHIPPERAAALKRQFGLDKPLPVQYVVWLVGNDWMKVDADGDGINESNGTRLGILRGDFGFSFQTRQPVLDEIKIRLPNTLYLMAITLLVALVIAIPTGILSAVKQYSKFDITITTLSFAGQAIPEFWLGLLLILVFYVWLQNPFTGEPLLPSGGMSSMDTFSIIDRTRHLILPLFAGLWVGSPDTHVSCARACSMSCTSITCAQPGQKACLKDTSCTSMPCVMRSSLW